MKILCLCGSTKKNSTNSKILERISLEYASEASFMHFAAIDQLPHFNPDFELEIPDIVKEFRNKVAEADALLISTPEYVFSLPGVLKNAIEWLVSGTYLSQKPAFLIVAAASGQKAMEALDLILNTLEMKIKPEWQVIIIGARGKISPNGKITETVMATKLDSGLKSFFAWNSEAIN